MCKTQVENIPKWIYRISRFYLKLILNKINSRSAVLASIGEHGPALRDISRALKRKYPQNLNFKLLERKAKSLVGLKLHSEAVVAFDEAEKVYRNILCFPERWNI